MKKEVKYVYPPVAQWRKASSKFNWVKLNGNEMTVLDDDYSMYLLVRYGGILRIHRFIPNAERPEGYSLVYREKYPPVTEWKVSRIQDASLKFGQFKILANLENGKGISVIVKLWDGICRIHTYLDYAELPELPELPV